VATTYDLRVVEVVAETADAHSVSLQVPAGAETVFAYRPGQFLTLAVPSDRTGVAARSYSLSSSPHDGGPLTVTVKRTAAGYASNWICDNLRAGSTIRVLPPAGVFTPADLDADLLLFAGGSGITPVMSIARTAMRRGRGRVILFYANRDDRSVIFARALAVLAAEHPDRLTVVHWLESVQGRPTADQLRAFASGFTTYDAFVCGPGPFMEQVMTTLRELGFPKERRHQETFVSLSGDPFGPVGEQPVDEGDVRLEVELDGRTLVFNDWAPTTRLLEHLESKGVAAPYSCREGECSSCAVRLLEGELAMVRNEVLDDEDLEGGIRLACQSLPVTDVVRVTYD
jgi:3-ketosteroid 9alpha-monooxygenase subunit B